MPKTPKQPKLDPFLEELDSMIEATEEFIRDDGLMAEECRIHDLSHLLYVRNLYIETFQLYEYKEQPDEQAPKF